VLAFINRGLADFSVSRGTKRARGWGIPVPDDPSQVMCGGAASGGLDAVLGDLLRACRAIGERLRPFLPDAAARITRQCETEPDGRLPAAVPALPRIECLDPA
jgi:methionyl-tRNA synthetase